VFGQAENLAGADPGFSLPRQPQYLKAVTCLHAGTPWRGSFPLLRDPVRQKLGHDDYKSIEAYIATVRNEELALQ
jgi:hypothetical protein